MIALIAGCAIGAPEPDNKPAAPPAEIKIPDVEAAIPAAVKALKEPAMTDFPGGIRMAVTAATDSAQAHVNQGMNHLHGGWEFEASRHFAAAMREDPECLLAHWGMVMCLLSPSPETNAASNAAITRMIDLISRGAGSELERGYAAGLAKYIEEGPGPAAATFRDVAARFPNDMQAAIFAALFGRTGYDETGNATPDQEAAEKLLHGLMEKNPDSVVPLHAYLTIRAEAPELHSTLELARKLCQASPSYPPYQHLLGHYEWRSGEHGRAAKAFGRAASFYEKWMRESSATVADCPEWVKAECYRVISLVSKGDLETASAAARQIAGTKIPKGRVGSPGGRILLWDGKTLPARVLLRPGSKATPADALASLPDPAEIKDTRDKSLAYWWIDGLRFALEARRLLDAGETDEARAVILALTKHGETMSQTQGAASANGERSAWTRAFRALEVLASDLQGRLAMAGPKERSGSAYNWFASAADRQLPAPYLYPPMILTPMSMQLGSYYLLADKPAEAIEAYERANESFPNDLQVLMGLKKACEAAHNAEKLAKTEAQIAELKSQSAEP